jgi:hypothetical protein
MPPDQLAKDIEKSMLYSKIKQQYPMATLALPRSDLNIL